MTKISHTQGEDEQFVCPWGTNIFPHMGGTHCFAQGGGGQIFYVGGGGGYDDIDEEMDVSEVSKLFAGARIFKGPVGPVGP